ncbi:MAG TPA: FG-GAP-like repeat-containing protein [Phycisphaerae bacterium]|nr:FG-GAP-like repeat-containing protein [Phycisphaerae bacterium]
MRSCPTLVTPSSDLKATIAVCDADGKLFELRTSRDSDDGVVDPGIDQVIRHASTAYYLVISRAPRAGLVGGAYEARVAVQRGGNAPASLAQTVYLDFRGGAVTLPGDEGSLTLGPFDPADIDPIYAGQNDTVREWIVRTVRQNYARYAVTVLSTDEGPAPEGVPVSTVYFGGYAPRSLGEALSGTDFYNADPSDDAVVFTERFTADLFTTRPDARGLGMAIGNVASHEVGHLLGLSHIHHATDIMNGYDAPDNLLEDQRFLYSLLNLSIFAVPDLQLGQDAHLLLAETVGLAPSAADVELPVCADPAALAVADLDEDGHPDIVTACPTSLEIWVFWNDGTGGFPAHGVAAGFGATSVGVADLDGNGHPDLFGTDVGTSNIFVYLNQGDGNFAAPQTWPVGQGPWSVIAADLTGDNRPDLAVANAFDDSVSILRNLGGGNFAAGQTVSQAAFPLSIAAGDFDGNGSNDMVFANAGTMDLPGGAWVLANTGGGVFLPPIPYVTDALAYSVRAADVNGDGWPDIVVADTFATRFGTGAAIVLMNNGIGGLVAPAYYMTGDQTAGLAVGDLNADGMPDIVVTNEGTGDVSVLLNRGDGTYEPEWPYRVGADPVAVTIGDLDADGRPDLIVANQQGGTLSVLLNKGAGRFGPLPADP